MTIREENPSDVLEIQALVTVAFKDASRSNGTEGAIIDALREQGALTVSLIAEVERKIVGHVAFSSVEIQGETVDWYGRRRGAASCRKSLSHKFKFCT